ncbi:tRNA (adenosine(37)-N6)-threonylcarbamoyltransferase complex dimerization subunit type 1 TsaB [Helcococcus sueciensis]|uniref:tRNA (adenosine(37)-N6)-threonylcarbamoyltransferase complex dimerization subunit type 1 TsaB n=1 Tax=Helcococcus sueciensis TaxID=241555 RepID=UPI00041AD480|nr:tRNA (adenosine(37)-N6)-threonylcarbamoyltransferase complex dimerization subunit type 1 TsaB [Helcococcus sueciensis]
MRILAVDTSTMMSSISILEDDKIIADSSINQEETHSEMLVPLIKRMLDDLKIKANDIDLFAIAKGPGSFTGLRIGMTSLKAMAQALDKPIIGVSTLKGMAYSIMNDGYVLAIIDARGNRYFAGLYKWNNNQLEMQFEEIIEENVLEERIQEIDRITIVGEAISKLPNKIKEFSNVKLSHPGLNNGISRNIAVLAKEKYEKGEIDNTFNITPNYLRKSQAEISFGK